MFIDFGREKNVFVVVMEVTLNLCYLNESKGIHRIKPDGTGYKGIITSGVGQQGIRGLAIDWIAGT